MINVVCRAGIGDVLTLFDILASDKARKWCICVPELLMKYRNAAYKELLSNMLERLCQFERHITFKIADVPEGSWVAKLGKDDAFMRAYDEDWNLIASLSWGQIDIQLRNFSHALCSPFSEVAQHIPKCKNYAVLTSRFRALINGDMQTAKKALEPSVPKVIEKLLSKYECLVIIGEPKPNDWGRSKDDPDYPVIRWTDPHWPSLMPKIQEYLEDNPQHKDRVIDLTTDEISIEVFMLENGLCSNAAKVVTYGHGGNYARQLYIDSNFSAIMCSPGGGFDHPITKRLMLEKILRPTQQIFCYPKLDEFIESL